jgi:hypothetical protein
MVILRVTFSSYPWAGSIIIEDAWGRVPDSVVGEEIA